MPDELTTKIIKFICRSLEDIKCGRAERITGSYRYKEIEVYIDIKEENEN